MKISFTQLGSVVNKALQHNHVCVFATVVIVVALLVACIPSQVKPQATVTTTKQPAAAMILSSPTSLPTRTPTPEHTAKATSPIAPTDIPVSSGTGTNAGSLDVGISLIGSHRFGDRYYFHVGMVEKDESFKPEKIEVVDPTTSQLVAGPFVLAEKVSELCRNNRLFETDGVDTSQFPQDFWYRNSVEPYYIYRVTVRELTGDQNVIDFVGRPFVCDSFSE